MVFARGGVTPVTMRRADRAEDGWSHQAAAAIVDKYDSEKRVALVVDEWGAWYAKLPGSTEGFLSQQTVFA
jgi:alpha-L-arabinofuranosidase